MTCWPAAQHDTTVPRMLPARVGREGHRERERTKVLVDYLVQFRSYQEITYWGFFWMQQIAITNRCGEIERRETERERERDRHRQTDRHTERYHA